MKRAGPAVLVLLGKRELRACADGLLGDDPDAVAYCVDFVCADTLGCWHNRARAMMCRRLKHIPLPTAQRQRLVTAILRRLEDGRIDEQFRDQLRLAIGLDPMACVAAASRVRAQTPTWVRRFGAWLEARAAAVRGAKTMGEEYAID
jgi:hypothetical protein